MVADLLSGMLCTYHAGQWFNNLLNFIDFIRFQFGKTANVLNLNNYLHIWLFSLEVRSLRDVVKMKLILSIMILSGCLLFTLAGCVRKNDYMPPVGATGEKIFKGACVQCHTPVNGKVMILRSEMANKEAIIERVTNGKGFGMPAFPNLTGDSVQNLAEYVLENSVTR